MMTAESAPLQPVDLPSQLEHCEITFSEPSNGKAPPPPLPEGEKDTERPMSDTPAAILTSNKYVTKPPILCLGFARTGTASLAKALRILGYPNVHHGTSLGATDPMYEDLGRAADASFPILPTYTGVPFTRANWDPIFGAYDAVTDIASFFAESLIAAYPDAQVILVERDIEKWYPSWKSALDVWASPLKSRMILKLESFSGLQGGTTSQKFTYGWTQTLKRKDLYRKAKQAYVRHYKIIRESVRPGLLLDFQLKDGWEPLCEFLGKEVPKDVEFPRINDAASYREFIAGAEKEGREVIKKRITMGKKLAEQRSMG